MLRAARTAEGFVRPKFEEHRARHAPIHLLGTFWKLTMAGATAAEAYLPVSLATIRPTGMAEFQLYVREDPSAPFRLYRDRNIPFDEKDLHQLASRGVKKLYVPLQDHEHYQQHLRNNLDAILSDPSLSASARCSCMNEVVRSTLSSAFDSGCVDKTVGVAQELAIQTVDLITQNDVAAGDHRAPGLRNPFGMSPAARKNYTDNIGLITAAFYVPTTGRGGTDIDDVETDARLEVRRDVVAGDLLSVMHHDYHTFTHSANVAYYCVMLARELSIADQSELVQIAVGGMLHDLGKLSIPEAILTKSGRLTDEEFAIIKRHPGNGFRQLSSRDDLNFAQMMMVYQHHERLDGTGYPVGVGANQIHEWAQICAVTDVYEALSSNRPYRSGLPKNVICDIIDRESGTHFNAEMWQCWKKTILSA